MPELPEVETVVRFIRPALEGKKILAISTPKNYTRALVNTTSKKLTKAINGQMIKQVRRRAKYIILDLDQGSLCIHLRMTGQLLLDQPDATNQKYITASFKLNHNQNMYFKDVRKFGKIYYYSDLQKLEEKLGLEPLESEFNSKSCERLLKSKSRMLKPLLLDQTIIAGIGNIYADEILWSCKLNPQMNSSNLTSNDCRNISSYTKKILSKSIELNGTTFQSFYFGNNFKGEFKSLLKVFGRENEPCKRCKTPIEKIRVAQRGTHYCPKCQKL